MKFSIEHTFQGVSLPDYEKLYFDEAFQLAICEAVKLKRTVLKVDRTESHINRHVRVEPSREIPAPIAKVLGGEGFHYVEELEYDLGKYRGRWRIVSGMLPDKVSVSGTLELALTSSGVKRTVAGEIKVSVFGIGGIIEKFVVTDIEKGYADAAAFTVKWLQQRGR
jgi:hypothetical protein